MKHAALRLLRVLAIITLVPLVLFAPISSVDAADVTNRYLRLEDPSADVVTQHTVGFNIVSGSNIGSYAFEYCSNSPLDDDPCTPPSGLDLLSATLDGQSGETGFSIHGNTTVNRMVLTRAVSTPTPGPVYYDFGNVHNPDTVGTHYLRLYTYISTDGTGPFTDRGGIAFSINEGVTVDAFVPPILIFCVGTTIVGTNCSTASGSSLDFGVLSETATRYGTTQMAAGTNGVGGYNISVLGTTMTSGNNIIQASSTPELSTVGLQQFGLNLVSNTSPSVGQSVTGPGTATPTLDYSQANRYKFANGDVVASSALPTDMDKYTVSYIVNVDPDQKAGVYTSTLTYVCLATF